MILAVKSIRPGMVGLSAGTGEMSRTDKPKLEDPLASEVFDTEEFANSAEGAARQEAAEAAAVADSAEADNKAAAPPPWG